ncbi:hypothetical protein ACJA88_014666 [Fusarium oxysporum]
MTEGTEVATPSFSKIKPTLSKVLSSIQRRTWLNGSYNDLIQTVDDALKHIFATVQSMPELQVVRDWWPSKDVFWLDETPIIPFTEALQMLRNDGRDIEGEDLSTGDEVRLGELVKQKYMADYYILDKSPAHTRPFYTNRAEGTQWANPFNIFLRGRWICTGGQRIHDEQNIRKSTEHAQITEDDKQGFITGFDLVAPTHGGASLSLEHLVATLLELGDALPQPPALDTDTTKPELRNNEPVRHDGGGLIG